jgi:hypothetical protein
MTIEERLRAFAAKGELVHISLAFYSGLYHAKLATASQSGGYVAAADADPVAAIEKVFAETPVKVRRPPAIRTPEPAIDVTAAVTEAARVNDEGLPQDWTTP